jgi:hypothetical protein
MANTLYEFYQSKGQKLPSISERSKTFEQLGLGSASAYKGEYQQNVDLLARLQAGDQAKPASVQPVKPPVASPVARVEAGSAQPTISPPVPTLPLKTTISGQEVPTSVGLFQQYQTDINKRLQELDERERKVLEAQKSLPSKADLLSTARTEQGLSEDTKRAQSLDERLAALEGSLFESERDIRSRINQSGGIVTESQVQRLAAAETKPLLEEYNRLSAERQRLGQTIASKEALARDYAGTKFEDLSRALGVAQTELEFGQKRYEIYADIAKDMLNASQKDITQIISMAQSKDEAERKAAEDAIDFAFKMADLAVKTPAGTTFNIGGQKVTGIKPASSSTVSTLSPTQFNIKAGLAGLTKDQANDVATKETPPSWFRIQEENKAQASLTFAELQKRWDVLRNKVATAVETKDTSDPFARIVEAAIGGGEVGTEGGDLFDAIIKKALANP